MKELEIRILKKIPDKYTPGQVLDEIPLDFCYGHEPFADDPYHIRLYRRSHYASMDDIKKFILAKHPEYDMHTWSMRGGCMDGPVRCSGCDWVLTISEEEMEGIKTEHIDEGLYEWCIGRFILELPYAVYDWMNIIQPFKVTKKAVRDMSKHQMEWFAKCTRHELEDMVEGPVYNGLDCDVPGFLAAAMFYAKKMRGTAFARIVD